MGKNAISIYSLIHGNGKPAYPEKNLQPTFELQVLGCSQHDKGMTALSLKKISFEN